MWQQTDQEADNSTVANAGLCIASYADALSKLSVRVLSVQISYV